MSYQPIENYGIIGDLHTAALVGTNGSIDWLCLPSFDSPSVFAAILDDEKGGRFQIRPRLKDVTAKQYYWPDTNVLITRFLSDDGVGEVVDFMPIREAGRLHHELVRRVSVLRGQQSFRMECRPAFDYARLPHELQQHPEGISFHSSQLSLGLCASVPLRAGSGNGAVADFTLREGQSAVFLLQRIAKGAPCGAVLSQTQADALLQATIGYWRRWVSRCTYHGRWREMVRRSALLLKLLIYEPTGVVIASPTCSLPEHIGGTRNWDYRYTWIRDAAFTLYGLMRIGFIQEAARFMDWLDARCHELKPDGFLQVLYGIDGRHDLHEQTLDHLEGYRGSRPVHVGNAAHSQVQLDICGELLDSVYLYNKYGSPISYDLWEQLTRLLNWVCDNWTKKDYGIWEVRGEPQHFVYSKIMCWVALDRGLRLAGKRSFPADQTRWIENRDAIYGQVLARGWSQNLRAFSQYYGSDTLDASVLISPLVFFLSPTDPSMLQTLEAVRRPTEEGGLSSGSLVYRYNTNRDVDGLKGDEGSFNMCTFWLVEALTRAGRADRKRLDEAAVILEGMLGFANHLGLYGEETGPRGEALGNFPQALTHLAFISAAFNLDRALSGTESDWPGVLSPR